MKNLIVMSELEGLSEKELLGLYRRFYNLAMSSEWNSPTRRNALASIENIIRALNSLRSKEFQPSPGPGI